MYYIGIEKQIEQLEEIGFFNIAAYNSEGEAVKSDAESHWIYYSAEK
jgi:hypothetical protein